MATYTTPGETIRQVSGLGPYDEFLLCVLAKRTYRIDPRGRCVPSEVQLPLQGEIITEAGSDELIDEDTDLIHYKPLTDIVVRGHGYVQQPHTQFAMGVGVGRYTKVVVALGERRASMSPTGTIRFSPPEPFTKIPLSFGLAYGGRDRAAEAKHGIPAADFAQYLPEGTKVESLSPYLYPRNPCGRGYLIEATSITVEELELPRLEDPEDPLRPERLVVGDPLHWPRMPVPQSLGWFGHAWFPRTTYFGVVPEHQPQPQPVFEVRKGWAPNNALDAGGFEDRFSLRAGNGASLGLQVPHLRGDEECVLQNLHPTNPNLRFTLPGDPPRIWTDGRKGKLNSTVPVLHSLIIEPDAGQVSLVWRGSAPALRFYMPEELKAMPLRVDW